MGKIQEGLSWELVEGTEGGLGLKEGGERVFLLVRGAKAQYNGCLLLGPSSQRQGRRGLVSGLSVAGFPAVSIRKGDREQCGGSQERPDDISPSRSSGTQ